MAYIRSQQHRMVSTVYLYPHACDVAGINLFLWVVGVIGPRQVLERVNRSNEVHLTSSEICNGHIAR